MAQGNEMDDVVTDFQIGDRVRYSPPLGNHRRHGTVVDVVMVPLYTVHFDGMKETQIPNWWEIEANE